MCLCSHSSKLLFKRLTWSCQKFFYGVDNDTTDHATKFFFWKSMKKEIELLRKILLHVQQLDFKCGECEFNTASSSEI